MITMAIEIYTPFPRDAESPCRNICRPSPIVSVTMLAAFRDQRPRV